jgi:hypothetical protein
MSELSGSAKQYKSPSLTKQQWLDHFKRCESSGLTTSAYVRSQGLKLSTFYRWRHQLLPRQVDLPAPVKPGTPVLVNPAPLPEPVFKRVMIKPEASSSVGITETIALRFRLPNGIDCELGGINPASFTGFVQTLARLRP